ncbi:MAG: carboxypeptidase regulatory-like domain-containing protein [Acidobacteria bacterium]|nr:carboxypeptidase regulatory-like domain-containing protein [Acidobacteriota bacterium]
MRKTIIAGISLLILTISVFAQTNTGRLVGTVNGPDGVVPGATVVIKDDLTGRERSFTSSGDGTFTVPQLEVGVYTITVTAPGFKSFTATQVKIDIGREYAFNAALEVGAVQESVTVTAGADILNAVTGELSNTVSNRQIIELPLNGRNPLALLSLQPGVSSNGAQGTSVNGLRTSFTNITRDGLNVQDGFIRSNATDFAPNRPSVDDTGEFTVVTSNSGADQNGGAQVRLVTPRGQNQFHGAAFLFNRNSALAANDFFRNSSNIDVPFLNRNNFGGRLGGPLPLPRFGQGGPAIVKDKAYFFFSYEGLRTRQQSLRTRTILLPDARNGIFTYRDNAGVTRNVNLFSLLPAGSDIAGIDPTVQSRILSALPTAGNRTDIGDQLNTTGLSFNQPSNQDRNSYTTRLDFDISEAHTINGIYTRNKENNLRPDVDGAQGFFAIPVVVQSSTNELLVASYRWTPGSRFTNEIRGGSFKSNVPFDRTAAKPGFFINVPLISNPEVTFLSQGRDTRYYNFQDNAELNISSHSIRFGGQLQFQEVDAYNEAGIVPTFTLGINQNTPALVTGNFTGGISPAQLNVANSMLALLGGIVSSGTQTFNVASKTDGFRPVQNFRDFVYGNHSFYVQDQWRMFPSLTLNLGMRYELFTALKQKNGLALEVVMQGDPKAAVLNPNGTYNYLGTNTGVEGQFHNTDKNNFAPVLSFAWSPNVSNSMAKRLLGGGGAFVVRGGYRMSYLNDQLITALNNAAVGNAGLGATSSAALNAANQPALNARLTALPGITPPSVIVPRTFAQNNSAAFGNFGTAFGLDPDIQSPRVQEYNFGLQREFGANAVEIRYVGGRSDNLWRGFDFNQLDITTNGFAADFNRARANLVLTNNPACTTAQNAGCQPLTVFPNLAGGGLLTNATVRNQLINGTPADLALIYIQNALLGTVEFRPNPNTGVADLLTNGAFYRYNALQAEYRRRPTKGLAIQANYTFSKNLTNGIGTSQALFEPLLDNARPELEVSRADFDQTHIFNANAVWEIPIGQGRWLFGNSNRVVDAIIGGWQFSPIIRLASGAPITITDPRGTFNRAGRSGRQTAVTSLSKDQIKDLIGIRRESNGVFFVNASAINTTGRAAEGFGTTPFNGQVFFNNAPGTTSGLERAVFNGPWIFNMDAALAKNFRITEGTRLQIRLEAFNALNNTQFFFGQTQSISSVNFGRITSTFGSRIVQLGARIDF